MAYLFGLFIVMVFFGVIHFYTELDTKQKVGATLIAGGVIMSAIFYNYIQTQKSEHIRQVMRHYNQGKNIQCGEITVTNKTFSLSVGTQTFIGLKESVHAGKMLSASGCE